MNIEVIEIQRVLDHHDYMIYLQIGDKYVMVNGYLLSSVIHDVISGTK